MLCKRHSPLLAAQSHDISRFKTRKCRWCSMARHDGDRVHCYDLCL